MVTLTGGLFILAAISLTLKAPCSKPRALYFSYQTDIRPLSKYLFATHTHTHKICIIVDFQHIVIYYLLKKLD